ncbi:protein fuzzy homolog isoform X4 [Phascolarctos cinereus]|uniref:Protein fuzzy homolog isoform X4 n=1 Tax=Phascolarctos cinereus TaxID=38626 RepID=A0A6P5LSX7_PHACI|nr:protein fuzzy homolog isoform X4 [Phascolarctos cinereus]
MAEEGAAGAVHLLCLAASSGVPLFSRSSRGGAPSRQQLPFSIIGSLNGVHMFGQNLDVTLRSARTEDSVVVWKTFHDSVTLIVLSSELGCAELRLERLLELVFGAMVLLVGLEELTKIRNVERLKKDLRAAYGLIDSLLVDSELAGDLTQCVDCIVPADGPLLQVPHRLLTLMLLPGLELCVLCGPQPPLSQVEPQVLERWWQPVLEPLRACVALAPRGIPAGFPLHPGILGLLLLHLEQRRGLFAVDLGGEEGPSPRIRRRLLRSFYVLVTATHFPPEEKAEEQGCPTEVPRACYVVSGVAAEGPQGLQDPGAGLRLVAVQAGPRRLLLLVSPQSPTYALRGLATRTLHALTPVL